jgi:ABC-type transporter Mla maintaining outer membrane lipid asymmetry permease subunit MlaE
LRWDVLFAVIIRLSMCDNGMKTDGGSLV